MALKKMTSARWKRLPGRLKGRMDDHRLTLVAAGVAFYAFLALAPTLVAAVSVYSLFADPADIAGQVQDRAAALPQEAQALLTQQLMSLATTSSAGVTVALIVAVVVALWSASAGMANLVRGVQVAQGREETRKFVAKRGTALVLTVVAILILVLMRALVAILTVVLLLALVAVAPAWLADEDIDGGVRWALDILRWPVVAVVLVMALAVLYHFAQPGSRGRFQVLTWGTLTGAGLWLIASLLFSLYTANWAGYNDTYGSVAGIVVMLLWLQIGVVAVMVGAEIDAELDSRAQQVE